MGTELLLHKMLLIVLLLSLLLSRCLPLRPFFHRFYLALKQVEFLLLPLAVDGLLLAVASAGLLEFGGLALCLHLGRL